MTETTCRREEIALCNPHQTTLQKLKIQPAPSVPEKLQKAEKDCMCEKQVMSEKEFLLNHSLYSTISSWLFAIAGATNIGVLSVLSSKVLMAAEKNQSLKEVFSKKKYNQLVVGMIAFGGACMTVSNWLESKKVVTEWQLGAGKLQRKYNIAENKASMDQAQKTPANPLPAAETLTMETSSPKTPPKNWGASMQPQGDSFSDRTKTVESGAAALG